MRNRKWLLPAVGLLLILGPFLYRTLILGYNWRSYTPPAISLPDLAVTPVPTLAIGLPTPLPTPVVAPVQGSVVVDFVHGRVNGVTESALQSLATSLAAHNVYFHYWTTDSIYALTPQERATQLTGLLKTAAGLIVFDSSRVWEEAELQVVDNFVRDGGRLLLISDPDFAGPQIGHISRVANRFGVVFDEGYLYNTEANDGNFLHIPLQLHEGSSADERIFAYGSHGVSGLVQPIAQAGEGTRSSLQSGASYFPVLAQGDSRQLRHIANVLAMGDFQLLTEPFVSRHANRKILHFVAGFLAGGARSQPMDSFPAFLDQSVEIFVDASLALDAGLMMRIAWLQEELAASGRRVRFASQPPPFSAGEPPTQTQAIHTPPTDTLYFGLFGADPAADALLRQMGDAVFTEDGVATEIRLGSGLRLDADETVLFLRRRLRPYGQLLAVLAHSQAGIAAGVRRLETGNFQGCFQESDRLYCPFSGGAAAANQPETLSILILNDDSEAQADSQSADLELYQQTLQALGYAPVILYTSALGGIDAGALAGFDWVIWNSDYRNGSPTVEDREALLQFLRDGGTAVTVSGGNVGWNLAQSDPAPVLALSPTGELVDLTVNLPSYLELPSGLPPVTALEATGESPPLSVLVQAAPSVQAGAPLLLVYQLNMDNDAAPEPILLFGLPLAWLPDGHGATLIRNMAAWIESQR